MVMVILIGSAIVLMNLDGGGGWQWWWRKPEYGGVVPSVAPLGSGRSGVQVAEASWHLPQPPKNFARMDAILLTTLLNTTQIWPTQNTSKGAFYLNSSVACARLLVKLSTSFSSPVSRNSVTKGWTSSAMALIWNITTSKIKKAVHENTSSV